MHSRSLSFGARNLKWNSLMNPLFSERVNHTPEPVVDTCGLIDLEENNFGLIPL
jgi:hypothetical protein